MRVPPPTPGVAVRYEVVTCSWYACNRAALLGSVRRAARPCAFAAGKITADTTNDDRIGTRRTRTRCGGSRGWSRLGSNQRPSACEADALPLSHGTGAERRTTSKTSTTVVWAERPRPGELLPGRIRHALTKEFVWAGSLDYRRASHRATISPVARGCSAVGSASPCQGEGRGFESRHPLEGANWHQSPAVEWPSGEATACKAVHTGSIPVSTSDFDLPARLAQRESASLTRKRSLVQSQYRAPEFVQFREISGTTPWPIAPGAAAAGPDASRAARRQRRHSRP